MVWFDTRRCRSVVPWAAGRRMAGRLTGVRLNEWKRRDANQHTYHSPTPHSSDQQVLNTHTQDFFVSTRVACSESRARKLTPIVSGTLVEEKNGDRHLLARARIQTYHTAQTRQLCLCSAGEP